MAKRYAHQMSGGQQQRVALARAPGDPAAGAAARRAAVGAGRQGAHHAARRDPPHPDRARHHHPVRHPRPGGGAGHLRSHRRDVERPARAAGHATRGLPPSVQRIRRPLRRLDERAAGHRAPARTRCGSAAWPSPPLRRRSTPKAATVNLLVRPEDMRIVDQGSACPARSPAARSRVPARCWACASTALDVLAAVHVAGVADLTPGERVEVGIDGTRGRLRSRSLKLSRSVPVPYAA